MCELRLKVKELMFACFLFLYIMFMQAFLSKTEIIFCLFPVTVSVDLVADGLRHFGVKNRTFAGVIALCSRQCSVLDIQCDA